MNDSKTAGTPQHGQQLILIRAGKPGAHCTSPCSSSGWRVSFSKPMQSKPLSTDLLASACPRLLSSSQHSLQLGSCYSGREGCSESGQFLGFPKAIFELLTYLLKESPWRIECFKFRWNCYTTCVFLQYLSVCLHTQGNTPIFCGKSLKWKILGIFCPFRSFVIIRSWTFFFSHELVFIKSNQPRELLGILSFPTANN